MAHVRLRSEVDAGAGAVDGVDGLTHDPADRVGAGRGLVGVEGVEALDPAGKAADARVAWEVGQGVALGQVAGVGGGVGGGQVGLGGNPLAEGGVPAGRLQAAKVAVGQASQYRVGNGVPSGSRGAVRTSAGSP